MAEMATLQVRVLWKGEIIERKFFGETQPATADSYFDSTRDKYNRQDPVWGDISVQLIDGEDVLYEYLIEGEAA